MAWYKNHLPYQVKKKQHGISVLKMKASFYHPKPDFVNGFALLFPSLTVPETSWRQVLMMVQSFCPVFWTSQLPSWRNVASVFSPKKSHIHDTWKGLRSHQRHCCHHQIQRFGLKEPHLPCAWPAWQWDMHKKKGQNSAPWGSAFLEVVHQPWIENAVAKKSI